MPKLGTILRVIGQGAAVAAQFTPAGAAVTQGLKIGGAVLGPQPASETPADSLHGIATQAVLDNLGQIIAQYGQEVSISDALGHATVQIEKWLTAEAARYTPSSK